MVSAGYDDGGMGVYPKTILCFKLSLIIFKERFLNCGD